MQGHIGLSDPIQKEQEHLIPDLQSHEAPRVLTGADNEGAGHHGLVLKVARSPVMNSSVSGSTPH